MSDDDGKATPEPRAWQPAERLEAIRGYLSTVRDGEQLLPRTGAQAALDHLAALEEHLAACERERSRRQA